MYFRAIVRTAGITLIAALANPFSTFADERMTAIGALITTASQDMSALGVADPAPSKPGSVKHVKTNQKVSTTEVAPDDRYRKCTQTPVQWVTDENTFVLFDSLHTSDVYPGAFLRGISVRPGSTGLEPIAGDRGPGTVQLELVTGIDVPLSERLDQADSDRIKQAKTRILSGYLNAAGDNAGRPAEVSMRYLSVTSAEELAIQMGANFASASFSASAEMQYNSSLKGQKVLIVLDQTFYTFTFRPSFPAARNFADSLTADDLRSQMGPGNPPLYVSGVSYGRKLFLLFQATDETLNVEATLKAAYDGASVRADGQIDTQYRSQLSTIKVSGCAVGGDAGAAATALSKAAADGLDGLKAVHDFMSDNARFSLQNPGKKVAFKLSRLSDSKPIMLRATVDYQAESCMVARVSCPPKAFTLGFGAPYSVVKVVWNLPAGEGGQYIEYADGARNKWENARCWMAGWERTVYMCQSLRMADHPQTGAWIRYGKWNRSAACVNSGALQPYMTLYLSEKLEDTGPPPQADTVKQADNILFVQN